MGWSWRLGRITGIDVYVHVTFLILLAWVAMLHFMARGSLADAFYGVGFILILFGIVVLHELGHALTARHFGIPTRDITLLPIGGVARLERLPEDPRQELWVALAGPAVNVVLAVLLFAIIRIRHELADYQQVVSVGGNLLNQLLWVNVSLAVFNLLPAFPMDGGRVLRALLAMRMDYVRATQVAARVGQAMALLFGFIGLFFNPFLVFIALFVWMGAAEEAAMVQMRAAVRGIPVAQAMTTEVQTLSPTDTVGQAARLLRTTYQQDFPVVQDDRVVGIVSRSDLLEALMEHGPDTPVSKVTHTQFDTAEPREMLESALTRLRSSGGHSLVVLDNGRLVGLVSLDNLGELLMIQKAGDRHPRQEPTLAGRPSWSPPPGPYVP